MSVIPIISSAADVPGALKHAERNPGSRWYTAKRLETLGMGELVPPEWGLTVISSGNVSDAKRKRSSTIQGTDSFPIENHADFVKAKRAVGRAKDPAKARAHIISEARKHGWTDEIPDDWKQGTTASGLTRSQGASKMGGMTAAAHWDPSLHPRDRDGQFIEVGAILDFFSAAGATQPLGRGTAIGSYHGPDGKDHIQIKRDEASGGGTVDITTDKIKTAPAAKAEIHPGLAKYKEGVTQTQQTLPKGLQAPDRPGSRGTNDAQAQSDYTDAVVQHSGSDVSELDPHDLEQARLNGVSPQDYASGLGDGGSSAAPGPNEPHGDPQAQSDYTDQVAQISGVDPSELDPQDLEESRLRGVPPEDYARGLAETDSEASPDEMKSFLLDKGYDQGVVDGLSDAELANDYQAEGGTNGPSDSGAPDTSAHVPDTAPPDQEMKDFLINKGYDRGVVDGLSPMELHSDFQDEGGYDGAGGSDVTFDGSEGDLAKYQDQVHQALSTEHPELNTNDIPIEDEIGSGYDSKTSPTETAHDIADRYPMDSSSDDPGGLGGTPTAGLEQTDRGTVLDQNTRDDMTALRDFINVDSRSGSWASGLSDRQLTELAGEYDNWSEDPESVPGWANEKFTDLQHGFLDDHPEVDPYDAIMARFHFARLGWSQEEQLKNVLDGEPLDEQNPNALRNIAEALETSPLRDVSLNPEGGITPKDLAKVIRSDLERPNDGGGDVPPVSDNPPDLVHGADVNPDTGEIAPTPGQLPSDVNGVNLDPEKLQGYSDGDLRSMRDSGRVGTDNLSEQGKQAVNDEMTRRKAATGIVGDNSDIGGNATDTPTTEAGGHLRKLLPKHAEKGSSEVSPVDAENKVHEITNNPDHAAAHKDLAGLMTQMKLGGKQRKRYRELLDAHHGKAPSENGSKEAQRGALQEKVHPTPAPASGLDGEANQFAGVPDNSVAGRASQGGTANLSTLDPNPSSPGATQTGDSPFGDWTTENSSGSGYGGERYMQLSAINSGEYPESRRQQVSDADTFIRDHFGGDEAAMKEWMNSKNGRYFADEVFGQGKHPQRVAAESPYLLTPEGMPPRRGRAGKSVSQGGDVPDELANGPTIGTPPTPDEIAAHQAPAAELTNEQKIANAATMHGEGSPKHRVAQKRFGSKKVKAPARDYSSYSSSLKTKAPHSYDIQDENGKHIGHIQHAKVTERVMNGRIQVGSQTVGTGHVAFDANGKQIKGRHFGLHNTSKEAEQAVRDHHASTQAAQAARDASTPTANDFVQPDANIATMDDGAIENDINNLKALIDSGAASSKDRIRYAHLRQEQARRAEASATADTPSTSDPSSMADADLASAISAEGDRLHQITGKYGQSSPLMKELTRERDTREHDRILNGGGPPHSISTPAGPVRAGDIITYRDGSERKRMMVTDVTDDIKHGTPGFGATVVDHNNRPVPSDFGGSFDSRWGYDNQVEQVLRKAPKGKA